MGQISMRILNKVNLIKSVTNFKKQLSFLYQMFTTDLRNLEGKTHHVNKCNGTCFQNP